jgi:hypothetical protein
MFIAIKPVINTPQISDVWSIMKLWLINWEVISNEEVLQIYYIFTDDHQ